MASTPAGSMPAWAQKARTPSHLEIPSGRTVTQNCPWVMSWETVAAPRPRARTPSATGSSTARGRPNSWKEKTAADVAVSIRSPRAPKLAR